MKGRIEQYGFVEKEDYIVFDSLKIRNQVGENKHGGGRRSKDYLLSIVTAKELAMIENNEKGREISKYFIRCEERLKQIAPEIKKKEINRLKARFEVANYSRPMCDALTIQRLSQGKDTKPYHYTNEFNMLNRIVLGMQSKEYRQLYNITGDIRDYFNELQLNHLAYLEHSNITLIEIGLDYQQRKDKLGKLSQSYLVRLLGEVA